MVVGDKIRLIKDIDMPTSINVTKILKKGFEFENEYTNEEGVSLKIRGYVPYTVYHEYFKVISKPKWSDWKFSEIIDFFDQFNLKTVFADVYARTNGVKVQLKTDLPLDDNRVKTIRSESTCCKGDKFDYKTGYAIAFYRLLMKAFNEMATDLSKHV